VLAPTLSVKPASPSPLLRNEHQSQQDSITMSNSNGNNNSNGDNQKKKPKRHGLDSLLQKKGKSLSVGQKISFTLVKGPAINRDANSDPVNPNAPKEYFPLIAKFPESVVRPNFANAQGPWHSNARLYQQDVPKAQVC